MNNKIDRARWLVMTARAALYRLADGLTAEHCNDFPNVRPELTKLFEEINLARS